jgi:hypothetical protein
VSRYTTTHEVKTEKGTLRLRASSLNVLNVSFDDLLFGRTYYEGQMQVRKAPDQQWYAEYGGGPVFAPMTGCLTLRKRGQPDHFLGLQLPIRTRVIEYIQLHLNRNSKPVNRCCLNAQILQNQKYIQELTIETRHLQDDLRENTARIARLKSQTKKLERLIGA